MLAGDQRTDRPAGPLDRRWAWVVLAATLAVAVLHLVLTRNVPGPSVTLDEAGYLGNARWIAGREPVWEMPVTPYYGMGYSLVLAPLHLVIDDPALLWSAVLVVNALLLASLVPLLTRLLRRVLDAAPRVALAGALVGALVPAAVAASASALSENLSLPLVVVLGLAAHAAVSDGPTWRRVWVGPTAALLYATHARFTPLVLVVAALVLVGWWRRRLPRAVAAVNLASLVVLTAAVVRAKQVLVDARWSQLALESGIGDGVDLVRSADGLQRLVGSAVGQAWSLAVGSLGLAVVGVLALARVVRARGPEGPAPTAGPTAGPAPSADTAPGATPRRAAQAAAGVLLLSGLGVFAVSVLFFANTRFRADHLVYGRHNDGFTPVWASAAVAVLLHRPAGRALRRSLAAAWGSVLALSVGVVALLDPLSHGGTYAPFAVPSLTRYIADPAADFYLRASAGGLAGVTVIALVTLVVRRPGLLVVPLVVVSTWSGVGRIQDVERFTHLVYEGWDLPDQVARLGIERASLNADENRGLAVLTYQYWMPGVAFDLYEPKLDEAPDETFVFSSVEDPDRAAEGSRIVLLDDGPAFRIRGTPEGMALWVRPGAEHEALAADGLLLPEAFPSPLPAEARAADLRLLDGVAGTTLTVAPGGRVTVPVEGSHRGTGAPWPDQASFVGDGRVKVVARIEPLDPDGVPGFPSGGELPAWIRPGEDFRTGAAVLAIRPFFVPLPEGRYRITLGIGQAGMDWFTSGGEDATFTLVVEE